jgi:cupin 2 domain-containing protein
MTPRGENIFAGIGRSPAGEEFRTLWENRAVKIERIVSDAHSSPPGFWYDQDEDEWVIVLRGRATLEFDDGELVEMKEGDHLTIASHVKHRVSRTGPETVWVAVRVKTDLK